MLFKLAWRNIWRNKRRTLISIASVLFAVVFAIIIKGMKEGMYDRMIDNTVGSYFGYVQIHADGYWDEQTLDNSFALRQTFQDSLTQNPYVKDAVPRIQNFALVSSDTITKGAMIMGIDPLKEENISSLNDRIFRGEMFNNDDRSAVIGYKLAEYLNLDISDTIVVMGQGYQGNMIAGKFPIKGLIKFPSPELNSNFVMLPLKATQELMSAESRSTAIILNLSSPDKMGMVSQRLKKELGSSYEVMDWEEMLPEIKKMIEGDRAEGVILMGILYLLVSFGIFGTVLMMLSERSYEFGIMVAIGMKKFKLALLVWFEMVILTLLGGVAGMIIAYPLMVYFNLNPIYMGDDIAIAFEEMGFEAVMQTSTDISILLEQGMIVIFLASIISIYPILKISHLNTIKAMRA